MNDPRLRSFERRSHDFIAKGLERHTLVFEFRGNPGLVVHYAQGVACQLPTGGQNYRAASTGLTPASRTPTHRASLASKSPEDYSHAAGGTNET